LKNKTKAKKVAIKYGSEVASHLRAVFYDRYLLAIGEEKICFLV